MPYIVKRLNKESKMIKKAKFFPFAAPASNMFKKVESFMGVGNSYLKKLPYADNFFKQTFKPPKLQHPGASSKTWPMS